MLKSIKHKSLLIKKRVMHLQYWLSFYDKPRDLARSYLSRVWQAMGVAAVAAVATSQERSGAVVLPTPRRS